VSRAALLAIALSFGAALAITRPAVAVERNFAGSAQLDYHELASTLAPGGGQRSRDVYDGFTLEAALKLAVDISDHLSANVKVCYGCHGFEADMAYFDLRAADELNLRVGRMSPSFGSFNLRHDPANYKLSDKPLPYDMGRMIRRNTWGNGVLPSPFPDNGAEINGTHWFGESVQIDYALYAVSGFKQSGSNPTDFNLQQSHLPYYVDNNARPTLGGRVAFTAKLGAMSDMTLGASIMRGPYDDRGALQYMIAGTDLSLRIHQTVVRLEYLVRRQEMDVSNPSIFKYEIAQSRGDFFVKHGALFEVEQNVAHGLDAVARADGMYRAGNVLETSGLLDYSWVARGTLGLAYAVERNLRLKVSTELWRWSDEDESGRTKETSFHVGAVGSF
jgi:hypothetical protein